MIERFVVWRKVMPELLKVDFKNYSVLMMTLYNGKETVLLVEYSAAQLEALIHESRLNDKIVDLKPVGVETKPVNLNVLLSWEVRAINESEKQYILGVLVEEYDA